MASSKSLIFGLYAVVKFLCLDVGDAQFSRTGIVSRDPFRQPPFYPEPVGIFTNHLSFPDNAIGFTENRQATRRSSRPDSYSNYGSRGKRSAIDYQEVRRDFPTKHALSYEQARVKRQAPMYQTWDFHPSSIARTKAADKLALTVRQRIEQNPSIIKSATELSNNQNNVANNAPANNVFGQLTTDQVNTGMNEQLPFSHFNAILKQNNLALDPKDFKVTKDTKAINVARDIQHKKPTADLRSSKIGNKSVVNRKLKIKNTRQTTGPPYSNTPSPPTANQLQYDLTFAAAALLNGDSSFDALISNDVNSKTQPHSQNKRLGTVNKVASSKQQNNNQGMIHNLQKLNNIIDRAAQMLMKKRKEKNSKDTLLKTSMTGRPTTVKPMVKKPHIKTTKHTDSSVSQGNIQNVQKQPTKAANSGPKSGTLSQQQSLQSMHPQLYDLQAQLFQDPLLQQDQLLTQHLMETVLQHIKNKGIPSTQQFKQDMLSLMASQKQSEPTQTVQERQQQVNQHGILNTKNSKSLQGTQQVNDQQFQQQPHQTQTSRNGKQLPKGPSLQQNHQRISASLKQKRLPQKKTVNAQQQPNRQRLNQQPYQTLSTNIPILQQQQQTFQKQMLNAQHHQTPRPEPRKNPSNQQMLNNQNQATPGQIPLNYQMQQEMLSIQNQPTPRPLSPNYQQQQQMLNNQNQPTPGPLSLNYQQQQQMLNNQNQPTPGPLSLNYQQQQQLLNNQNQPTPGPLSPNYQQQQQMLNNQNQPTPGPLSPNYQQQQQMLNNQNQPTPGPLSLNYQQQQQMLNNQNQPTPGPLSLNYQQQQQMLNNQNQPTPGPLSPNYQQQQQMLNYQNQPTPGPLSLNYQQQQQMLNNQNQPTPGPLSPNYQQQQQMLNNQNQPTPGPLSPNYQQQQQLLNNQNQPTPGPLSPNYQQQQQMLNNQNQPTPGPLSLNYQQQQQMLNNQNQPTPGPLSPNYQQQQQLLNNQNQPTPGPLSPNYQQQQQMLNNQNQPTPGPLSLNYQQQQQMLNNQNQPTPGPLSPNYQQQQQQQLLNNQNQPTPGPLSPNYQQQQQMLNYQNQPTPGPLSLNYQQQQQMLNNQNQPTPGPLSPNYQQQQQMLNNQNLPTPGPFPPNYQQKQQILSNQNQPTPGPLSANYQHQQQQMLNNQNQPTPRPLSPNYQQQQQMLNNQNQPIPGPLSPNYQQQQQMLNNQNQPTPRPLSSNYQQQQQLLNNQNQATHMNRPKLQQQFLQNKQHHQQQLNPTQGRNSQSNKSQLSPSKQNQNPNTKHAQQRTNQKSMLSHSQTILSQQNMQQPHRQTFSAHTVQTPLPQIPTLASASKPVKSNAVQGIPLSIDGPGLSAFNHVPSTKRQPQAKGTLKKTPTPFPSRKVNSRKNGQRRRIPHERYIMYRSTTTSSPRHSERRRQRNHGKRISRPSKEVTTVPSTNHFPKRPLKPMRLWNSSPNTSAGNPVWRQPLEQIHRTQSSHPTPIVPSPPNTPSTRGSVNGGSYIKNWFHPRKFENTHGNTHEPVQIGYSETGNSNKSHTKNNKQRGSVGRQRTRSEQIISQQTRNGRRPGIRLLSKDSQQSKDLPKRKKQPYTNDVHYSFKTTAKPSVTPTSSLPSQKSMGSAANLHHNAWNKPNSATTIPPIYSTGNTWNQYPEKERLFSATADAFKLAPGTVNLSLNAHLNKSNVKNNVSNQSTVSDVKKNKTISITQHIKTSNNASQGRHNHAHAPINFNVFLEVKPTPKPQQNSSQAAEMLKLLEALQILRGTMSPPTTMHPPVKFVFQMEPNVQQPAKLMCKCFKKSDGCPAELKEEHLMDMCYDNDTIPCCDDG